MYASIFNPDADDEGTELLPIETDKEWKVIETILSSLQEEVKNATGNESSSTN